MYICLMYASYKNTYDNLDIERPMMRSQGCWYHVLYGIGPYSRSHVHVA